MDRQSKTSTQVVKAKLADFGFRRDDFTVRRVEGECGVTVLPRNASILAAKRCLVAAGAQVFVSMDETFLTAWL